MKYTEKKDIFDTELFRQTKVKTLDELSEFYYRLEKLLLDNGNTLYYNLYAAMAQKNAEFFAHYGKSTEEINAIIDEEGYDKCSEPYVKLSREIGDKYSCIANHYSGFLTFFCGNDHETEMDNDISSFVTNFELLEIEAETADEPCAEIAGKAVPYRWIRRRFIEFDSEAWEKIFLKYCAEWSPGKMAERKIKYIPEYSAEDKMLAYYLLDFWYERM